VLDGFKNFLLWRKVLDLAVAVVMAAAFISMITTLTDRIIRPLLNAITPRNSPGLSLQLVAGKPSTLIDFAGLISSAINFFLVAIVVYYVFVLPMRAVKQRRAGGEEPGPVGPGDVELLTEIRDLLRDRQEHARSFAPDVRRDGGNPTNG
jgi:large conductance mechanosensitive channel